MPAIKMALPGVAAREGNPDREERTGRVRLGGGKLYETGEETSRKRHPLSVYVTWGSVAATVP